MPPKQELPANLDLFQLLAIRFTFHLFFGQLQLHLGDDDTV